VDHVILNDLAISQVKSAVNPHHTKWIIQFLLQQCLRLYVQSICITCSGSCCSQYSNNISD